MKSVKHVLFYLVTYGVLYTVIFHVVSSVKKRCLCSVKVCGVNIDGKYIVSLSCHVKFVNVLCKDGNIW